MQHNIIIKNKDKIFFPCGITKGDLIDYYKNIYKYIIKYIENRPIMMDRFPEGINGKHFYQKNVFKYFPKWIKTVYIKKKSGFNKYLICNDEDTLVYLINEGVISLHIWQSQIDNIYKPNRIVFDLDIESKIFENNLFNKIKKGALIINNILKDNNIKSYLMTTGSKGLHIIIYIKAEFKFNFVKNVCKNIASYLEKNYPDIFTTKFNKEKRDNKIFIDIYRNQYAQTSIAPYSVRAIDFAPIAMPIDWTDLNNDINAQSFNILNVFEILKSGKDPWKDIDKNIHNIDDLIKIYEK